MCCRNHPTATGCQSKWAESQSDEQWKKTIKKQFCQSHEDQIDNTRYPCCGMVVGPGEGKGCTSTHPCCGAAQVLLFCFWLCQAKSAAPSANATMFFVGIRKPNSWGAYKKKVIFGGLSANAPSQRKIVVHIPEKNFHICFLLRIESYMYELDFTKVILLLIYLCPYCQ